MVLKLLFFLLQNHKNYPAAGGSSPSSPSVARFSCISLSKLRPKLDNFYAKKNYFWFTPLSKILIARLVAFTIADRAFKRLWAADINS